MSVYQQDVGCDQEIALFALVAAETVTAHHVFPLGFAVTGYRDGFDEVFIPPGIEFRAWQQGVAKNIDVGKGGEQLVQVAFEIRQVVAWQAPDQFRRDRHPLLRHGLGDRPVFI